MRGEIPNGKPDNLGSLENQEKPLKGKVVLITGSSRDIGAHIAIALARDGADIIGNHHRDLRRETRESLVLSAVKPYGTHFEFILADITIEEGRNKLYQTTQLSFGKKLDTLILNASGPTEELNVVANNELVTKFLPIMPKGGKIVLMQSVPGHFFWDLYYGDFKSRGIKISDVYEKIAEAKNKGERSLMSRIEEFDNHGVSFFVVCPPEVNDTLNMRIFRKRDPNISKQHSELSDLFGLPLKTVSMEDVASKVASLLTKDLPQGYLELFK